MRLFSTTEGRNRPAAITPWTLVHFLTGVAAWLVLTLFTAWDATTKVLVHTVAHAAYEVKDAALSYGRRAADGSFGDNSWLNSIFDLGAGIAGNEVARRLFPEPNLSAALASVVAIRGVQMVCEVNGWG